MSSSASIPSSSVPAARVQGRTAWRTRLAWVGGALLVLAVVVYFAIGAVVVSRLTLVKRKEQKTTPAAYQVPFEDVQIKARDGVVLAAWFMPASGSDRAVILAHGKDSCRSCEFKERFVEFASRLQAQGFNILMIDLRGHGASSGERFTLGDHERWDVLGAMDWLQTRGFTKIGVLGVSMGAASTVKAAVDPNGGQGLKAVVLDSGFGSLREVLEGRFPSESGLSNAFLPGSLLMARVMIQTDLDNIRPVEDLPRLQTPVLLIFGALDDLVPLAQFQAMAAARPGIESWLVNDAGHASIYTKHTEEYIARVSAFFDKTLR